MWLFLNNSERVLILASKSATILAGLNIQAVDPESNIFFMASQLEGTFPYKINSNYINDHNA